jgi:hypothetical protein
MILKNLNQDILKKIYEYDYTYHEKYKRIINFINLLPRILEVNEKTNLIKFKSNLFFFRNKFSKNYRTHKQLLVVSPDLRSTDFFPFIHFYKYYFHAIRQAERYFVGKKKYKNNLILN